MTELIIIIVVRRSVFGRRKFKINSYIATITKFNNGVMEEIFTKTKINLFEW